MTTPVLTYCIPVALSYCNSKQLKTKRIERRSISIIKGNSKNIDVKLPSFHNTIKNRSCMLTHSIVFMGTRVKLSRTILKD